MNGATPDDRNYPMRLILNHAHLLALSLSAGALIGACDIDKPIGELGPYEPCEGKKCGDACSVCDPDDKDCVETAVIKACDAEGACVAGNPGVCEDEPAYDPCADKACGDTCSVCAPDDLDCAETAVVKACNGEGVCVPDTGDLCEPAAYDPCAGKAPCDECLLCAPDDPDCAEDAVIKVCDDSLQCVVLGEGVCEGPAPWTPCDGKACGDECTQCDPNDLECAEDAVIKACDGDGQCVPVSDDLCEPAAFDPCKGKAACDLCSFCDPNDPDCIEDAAVKVCDESLQCVYQTPGICQDSFNGCEGKACGEQCTLCDPNDPDCVEDQIFKVCDPDGVCVADQPDLCK